MRVLSDLTTLNTRAATAAVVAVAILSALTACAKKEQQGRPSLPVTAASVVQKTVSIEVRAIGTITALAVTAAVSGDKQQPARGVLTVGGNAVSTATGTIDLKATFPNNDRKLWAWQHPDSGTPNAG